MKENITITNRTMELKDCEQNWYFDNTYKCWCLEDILYTPKPVTPKFQRLSIFVPEAYMSSPGQVNREGMQNGYSSATVPVVFENNSAGYMQMPHVWLGGPRCYAKEYLEQGYVYVTCGNRGHESKDEEGKSSGKAPLNLIDLKMAIRFLRHNRTFLPGNMDHMIAVGWSAGGAMTTLLSVTGNHKAYEKLLQENGAFMEESDAVYAAQIYCPIIDLEHSDQSYEWMFSADHENESSPAGPAGSMNDFEAALSGKLKEQYITYFNGLQLHNPENNQLLTLNEDGRSGSGYRYFMDLLNQSATKYLSMLSGKGLPASFNVSEYLAGEYLETKPAPAPAPKEGLTMSLGDLLSRPPKGFEGKPFVPPMMEIKARDKSSWLSWNGREAKISDLDSYVLSHRHRMKPCTAFDQLTCNSGENKVFGTNEEPAVHFNPDIADAILTLQNAFPREYHEFYPAFAKVREDKELLEREKLMNPLNFIGTNESADQAKYYRIRVGAMDADTSLSVSMTLALKLLEAGNEVDYEMVWDQPHSEADYPGEAISWMEQIMNSSK